MGEMTEKRKKAIAWAEGVVEKVNDDPRPYVKCKESRPITDLKDLLNSSAQLYGDNTAYLQKWDPAGEFEPIKYKQVLEDVNALGSALLTKGLKGKRVAVIGPNCYQWCSAYLAVTGGIGCIVPLDKELNAAELKNQIKISEVSGIFFDKKHLETFKAIKADEDTGLDVLVNYDADEEHDGVFSWKQLIAEGKKLIADGDRSYIDAEVDNEIMSVLLFTSGTMGKPKGVMLSQKNLCAELMIAPTIFDLEQTDRYLSFLPLHHTYECTCCFLMAIYKGASVAFCQGLKYLMKNMQEVNPTMMLAVPALYEKMYRSIMKNVRKQGKEKALKRAIKMNHMVNKVGVDFSDKAFKDIKAVFGGKMKTLICGGAKIDPEILDGLQDLGFNALQGYGLTEAAPMGAFNPQDAPNSRSVGVPFPGQGVKTINANEDGIGEICIKGENIMLGYYNDPEETARSLDKDGWFHTGDLGYIDEKGYVYLTGRAKNVIITKNGKNVYPEEIEYQLTLIDFVEEAFVYEDEKATGNDTIIVAAVKTDPEEVEDILGPGYTDDDVKEIIWKEVDKINDSAPPYRKIKKVVLRKNSFVHNTSAKLMRMDEDNKKEE